MKKLLNFNRINFISIFKGLILLFLLFFFTSAFNTHAQDNIISRDPLKYTNGEVPGIPDPCADPSVLSDDACIIILKPAQEGVPYSFQIPLNNEGVRADLEWTFTQYGGCTTGSISCSLKGDINPGTISMAGSAICVPDNGANYIQFYIEVANFDVFPEEEDKQRYRIPILRTPVKVVLVLDRSGSMGWPVPGGTEIRWEVLKKSVWEFTKQLEIHQQIKDSIGLTFFMTHLIQPGIPIEDGFEYIPPNTAIELVSDTINYQMNLQNPGGATAMGLGLKDARSKLEGNTPIEATKIVLLFTDGLQNVYPRVQSDGRTLQDGSLLNDNVPPPIDPKDSIRYYTIGMGSSTLVPQILTDISSANSGVSLNTITGDASDFEWFFQNQLVNMLNGGSPQIVSRQVGKLINGVWEHTFTLNGGISHVLFKVSFNEGDNLNFTVEKNGIEYTPEAIVESSFVKMKKIKFPIINDDVTYAEGEWTVTVTGDSDEEYYVTCIADDHFSGYSGKPDKNIYISGEYIDFVADMTYAGETLIGANDSIKVTILKPGDDIGHLLATYSVPDDVIDYTNEDLSPEEQKFMNLMNDPNFYSKLLPDDQTIKLDHHGNGIYRGIFDATALSGVYQAIYKFYGDLPAKGRFEREKLISIVVINGGFVNADVEDVNDNTPPSVPSDLSTIEITHEKTNLKWDASLDNVMVKNYKIYQNSTILDSTTATSYQVVDLDYSTEYSFHIVATDYGNNHSGPSNELAITTLDEPDTEAPTAPADLIATDITQTNLYLNWNASTDNINVTGYRIFQNDDPVAGTENTSYLVTNLTPGTNYTFSVTALDEEDNESEQSNIQSISTLDVPVELTAPTKLTALNITQTTLNLRWETSTGNTSYFEYEIYQDASLIGTTSNITYSIINLEASTSYSFHVIAKDSEGVVSDASNVADAITLDVVEDIEDGYTILTIRPINKFGYYLGPGFKRKIKLEYKSKRQEKPVIHKSSMVNPSQEQNSAPEPYLKHIKDNLDGSYYLIVANVLPKTNPNIAITIGNEVYYEGPINGKLPIWFYILIILILLILIILWLTKSNKKALKTILWLLLIILLVILYLHRTGFLNFL